MAKLSRRKLATYAADQLAAGKKDVLLQLAAYLIDNGRTKEAELLVRDIETALLKKGTAAAHVTAARPLSAEAKADIEAFIKRTYDGIKAVELAETIDDSVIGGMKLNLPDAVLDATVKTKLEKLTA